MIFTRRFGALAARPNFREADDAVQEPATDVLSAEAEVESESVYVGSR